MRGFLFSIDALFASVVLISALLIFSTLYVQDAKTAHLSSLANDMLDILSELKMEEINNSYVEYLRSIGEIRDGNLTVLEQVGEYWALNKSDQARYLFSNVTERLFPRNMGYSFTLGDGDIYTKNFSSRRDVIASRKMISGYEKSKPLKGSTSRAYLKSIREKTFDAYAYFL